MKKKKLCKSVLSLISAPFLLAVFVIGFPIFACMILKEHIDEWL